MQVALGKCCPVKYGGNVKSIESIVSDAIFRSWLKSTKTGSCPFSNFSSITASS